MDEILIGDKKYVSSKRAAKITGYAKDYIGQLCREGRVPARLVGRSWYVLDSAIQDHRFGTPVVKEEERPEPTASLGDIWETPRYESIESEVLPMVNRLYDPSDRMNEEETPNDSAEHLQATWQAWFSRISPTSEALTQPVEAEIVVETPDEPEDVPVVIHTMRDIEPERVMLASVPPNVSLHTSSRGYARTIQMTGALIALIAACTAVLGTGYFDSYIISNSQARMLAGVTLYNR